MVDLGIDDVGRYANRVGRCLKEKDLPSVKVVGFFQTVQLKALHIGRLCWVLLNLGKIVDNSK